MSTWIFENRVPLSKRVGVFRVVFCRSKTMLKVSFLSLSLRFAFFSPSCLDFRAIRGHRKPYLILL